MFRGLDEAASCFTQEQLTNLKSTLSNHISLPGRHHVSIPPVLLNTYLGEEGELVWVWAWPHPFPPSVA